MPALAGGRSYIRIRKSSFIYGGSSHCINAFQYKPEICPITVVTSKKLFHKLWHMKRHNTKVRPFQTATSSSVVSFSTAFSTYVCTVKICRHQLIRNKLPADATDFSSVHQFCSSISKDYFTEVL